MTPERSDGGYNRLPEIAGAFLKIGAMSYGGPAIMGIMQAEIQEKRQWVTRERFVEGLALVNMLPGPGATQLGIFLGHARAGWRGGVIAGLGFMLPAFLIMLVLTMLYTTYGTLPALRNAFYGIGPVVIGIFAVAVYRLAAGVIKDAWQIAIALIAAAAMAATPLGIIATLLLAGASGISLYDSPRRGARAAALIVIGLVLIALVDAARVPGITNAPSGILGSAANPGLSDIGYFFFKVGAFTFAGGLSMIAFIEDQVVNQLHWLTAREFLDGLALGQVTPGPILMLAAFVGYKLFGVVGATVAAGAIFLPSFLLMLSIIPALNRVKQVTWLKAFMRGVGPAVIGVTSVSLGQMIPHAAPDGFTLFLLVFTALLMLLWKIGPLPLVIAGGVIGAKSRTNGLERLRELAP
ncbi:MAG: chromate efflux transporter [Betaproteobacteria bacterium]|nr:chromate efflux transporter [Betaproteobacteria bacterium]